MESIDPEEARHKLTETYELMTEDELGRVAEDAYDLTDLARETLQTEIAQRGFKIQLKTAPPPSGPIEGPDDDAPLDISDLDLAVVASVRNISEATQVKEILDAACIPWCLGEDNITDLNEFKESFGDGVYLSVLRSDRARARNVLGPLALTEAEAAEEQEDDEEEESGYAVVCPKCQSVEVDLQEGAPESPALSDDTPLNWICGACGHRWKDEGIDSSL